MRWEHWQSLGEFKTVTCIKECYGGRMIIHSEKGSPWSVIHYRFVPDGHIETHIRSSVRWLWLAKWLAYRWLRRQPPIHLAVQ